MGDMNEEGDRSEANVTANVTPAPESTTSEDVVAETPATNVPVTTIPPIDDADDDFLDDKPKRKRWLWWLLGILVVLAIVAGLSWKMGWYTRAYNHFNRGQVSLSIKEGGNAVIADATVILNGSTYVTDSTGKVQAISLVAGNYPVVVRKTGYQEADVTLALHRGDNGLQTISMTLLPEKLYSIKGFIQDYVSGLPLVGVTVSTGQDSTSTDASGAFTFTKQPAATYSLKMTKSGYIDKTLPITVTTADSVTATIPFVPVGTVVFTSNESGKRGIFTVNYDGSNRQAIAASSGEEYSQRLSPDGKNIAFLSTRDAAKDAYGTVVPKLYIVGIDGKTVKKVSDALSEGVFSWSSNSKYVYFEGYATADFSQLDREVYDVTKGTVFDLGSTTQWAGFSPDGNSMALITQSTSSAGASAYTLGSIVLATAQRTTLISNSSDYLSNVLYAADGRSISYSTQTTATPSYFTLDLTKAGATPQPTAVPATSTRRYVTAPDGVTKVFVETRDGKKDLFLAKTATTDTNLSNISVVNDTPLSWDASSTYVTFGIKREGEQALYVVSVLGGTPKKVTDYYSDSVDSQQ